MAILSRKNAPVIVRFFSSLELTITCLTLGMALIFFGTLAQVHLGTHQVQEWFFHSWVAWWPLDEGRRRIPILPGGYLIGGVLLANLIVAFVYRFEWSARKYGLLISHFGLIVLLVGELGTALYQRDSAMWLNEGQTKEYAESFRNLELAIIDRTDPATDKVVAIHEDALRSGREFTAENSPFPFRVKVHDYYSNAEVYSRGTLTGTLPAPLATVGAGTKLTAQQIPRSAKDRQPDLSIVWVELVAPSGSLGVWMINVAGPETETFTHEGRTYSVELRSRRYYQPFSLTLLDFSHDRYPGTEIPRNFSSRVRLNDRANHESRETLIYMNHPLRHAGLTFYQESYDGETRSMLRVVRNPSRHLPYIACVLVFVGLTIQFRAGLKLFLERRKVATT